ncbi:MAG: hypothetical protein HOP07_08445 [Bacteriovoracaceae bacterium]|nr:hypothetical protein [Bacteriovoracaceae bacterium]
MATVDFIKTISDFFLLSVAWSLVLFSVIANSKLTGAGLIKLLTNTSIGALVISMVIGALSPSGMFNNIFGLKLFALLGLILVSVFHQDEKSKLMYALYLFLCGVFLYLVCSLVNFQLLHSLFFISAGLFLGIITYSMLLGHWYLVVPKLSAHPLKIAAIVMWIILIIKITWSSYSLFQNYGFFEEQTQLGAGYAFNWMLLLMRVSFGYLVILGMSFFNWKLLQLRSIQSSTGILYAMTFFVFIGELVSIYMFLNYGLFI